MSCDCKKEETNCCDFSDICFENGGIRIKVVEDECCIEIAGEKICLIDAYKCVVSAKTTNCCGICEFKDLRPGEYFIKHGKHLCCCTVEPGSISNMIFKVKEHKKHNPEKPVPRCPSCN